MILADSFCQSSKARFNEFTTTESDSPLIVQFAANTVYEFVDASKLVYDYADGVDLNCGCPQKWAVKDGYGCALLSQPEIIHSLVRMFKNSLPNNFSVSVKMRLLKDLKKTIDLCQQLEKCGVTFLTIHARTQSQKSSEDIDVEGLKQACSSIQIPVIANGGIRTLEDAKCLYEKVNCNGVMSASGLLTNPALFSGSHTTPVSCVKEWMNIKDRDKDKITFQCYHHHLVFMLEKTLTKKQKQIFNYLNTFEDVDNFLIENIIMKNEDNITLESDKYIICNYSDSITKKYFKCKKCNNPQYFCNCHIYDTNHSQGIFFSSHLNDSSCELDFMDCSLFQE